jgi:transposase
VEKAQQLAGNCLCQEPNATLNSTISTMRRGKRLSADIQQVIMSLIQSHRPEGVAKVAQVGRSTVYRVTARVEQHGCIPSPHKRSKGTFKSLNDAEIRVSSTFVSQGFANLIHSTSLVASSRPRIFT